MSTPQQWQRRTSYYSERQGKLDRRRMRADFLRGATTKILIWRNMGMLAKVATRTKRVRRNQARTERYTRISHVLHAGHLGTIQTSVQVKLGQALHRLA